MGAVLVLLLYVDDINPAQKKNKFETVFFVSSSNRLVAELYVNFLIGTNLTATEFLLSARKNI
jgi:hypothetical protein